jgi:hypothetical protein
LPEESVGQGAHRRSFDEFRGLHVELPPEVWFASLGTDEFLLRDSTAI